MLLAKCCHDLDWIRYIMGSTCTSVQSFGTLKHFRADQKPAEATDRCLDCPLNSSCPYSANKIYLSRVAAGDFEWPVDILTPDPNEASVLEALRNGPYGRCVYACDNDVVDNQVVNMLFENGSTASLTMTAFTEADYRQTQIFGTKGQLISNGRIIRHFDFQSDKWKEINTESAGHSILGGQGDGLQSKISGHGGGDYAIMKAFVDAVRHNDQNRLLSGSKVSLETHLMVFAAEISRRENRVVKIEEMGI
jgi:predicted dehydrogenase